MIIKLEIPDSMADQRLTLIAGSRELVAKKNPVEDWWLVKKTRCNFCGECCMAIGDNWAFPPDDEGKCTKLVKDGDKWKCSAKYNTPVRCIPDPLKENAPGCCITYETQKVSK